MEGDQEDLAALDAWDPAADHFNSPTNTLAEDPDPLAKFLGSSGLSNRKHDYKIGGIEICHRYAKYGSCVDGDYCTRKHVSPGARKQLYMFQNELDKRANRKILTQQDIILSAVNIDPQALRLVEVTSVKSMTSFHMVAPYQDKNFVNYTLKDLKLYLDQMAKLSFGGSKVDKMHKDINELLGRGYRLDNVRNPVFLGQLVVCKMDTGRFLRDVGLEIEVDRLSIHDIPDHIKGEPPLAIQGSLNVTSSSNEANDIFKNLVDQNKLFFAQMLHQSSIEGIIFCNLLRLGDKKDIIELIKEKTQSIS